MNSKSTFLQLVTSVLTSFYAFIFFLVETLTVYVMDTQANNAYQSMLTHLLIKSIHDQMIGAATYIHVTALFSYCITSKIFLFFSNKF